MAALVWVMVGLAIWHFTIFLPDRFWGGIVGAFVGAIAGSILFGLVVHGFDVPGQEGTDLTEAAIAVPGSMLGMAVIWLIGVRAERAGETL